MKNKIKKMFKNKRNIKSLLLILASIIVITGITYSSFFVNFNGLTVINTTSPEISMTYTEQNNALIVDNIGLTVDEGKELDNYFEFTVSATNDFVYDLYYRIYLTKDSESGLSNDKVYVYLTEVSNDIETEILAPTKISELTIHPTNENSYIIKRRNFMFLTDTEETKTKTYRLRAWKDSTYSENDITSVEDGDSTTYSILGGSYYYTVNVDTYTAQTLYGVMKANVKSNSNISYQYINNANTTVSNITYNNGDNGVFLYNGTDDNGGNQDIYYYRGAVTNNNVLFGGYCWKMVRTTSTGGTKLIYNGAATLGLSSLEYDEFVDLTNDTLYPFTYDSTTKKWTSGNYHVSGTTSQVSFKINNSQNKNYYLDYSVSSESYGDYAYIYKDGTQLGSYYGTASGRIDLGVLTSSNVITVKYKKNNSGNSGSDNIVFSIRYYPDEAFYNCTNTGSDTVLSGTSAFNSSRKSLSDVGYMYGSRYEYSTKSTKLSIDSYAYVISSDYKSISSTSYYYYDDKTYTNPQVIAGGSDATGVVGKWTCFSTTDTTCTTPYYIAGLYYNYARYSSSDYFIVSDTISYADGTYTLANPVSVDLVNYYSNYSDYEGKYVCSNRFNTTCGSSAQYITTTYDDSYITSVFKNGATYDTVQKSNKLFGNSVTYADGTYTLVNTVTSNYESWPTDRSSKLANGYHYTCLNATGTCSSVYYIYYFGNNNDIYYITLTGGDTLDTVKSKMFTNTNNSTIKTKIDSWYSANLSSYSNYLENTIFCNDRSFASGANGGSFSGKDVNSTVTSNFSAYDRMESTYSPSLTCANINDRFSLSTENGGTTNYGNNKLTYPIGLLTLDEANLAGGIASTNKNYYLYSNYDYWLLTPYRFSEDSSVEKYITSDGELKVSVVSNSYGVRPVISLKEKLEIDYGEGTTENPYVIMYE